MILMNNFKAENSEIRNVMVDAVSRVIESGSFILGNELRSFEKLWAKECGVDFGVGVANGMDAIEIILRAYNIGPGSEVITTSMTAFATVLAILRAGAVPVLADIEEESGLLAIESVKRCITKQTRAVILVHLYGQLRDMKNWHQFCANNNILLIEDCAQSHLARWGNSVAGGFGEAGAYSFYPTKNLGALGDAGMIVTNSDLIHRRAIKLRNYGQSERYHHPELGLNSRLDELQAAILIERLAWLEQYTERRKQIAKRYQLEIQNRHITKLSLPQETSSHVYHLYVVTCLKREELQAYLNDHEIQSLIHYPVPVHHQPPLRDCRIDPAGLSASNKHAKTCLSLPCHPHMGEDEVNKVIQVINKFQN